MVESGRKYPRGPEARAESPLQLPSMSNGFGLAFGYNFHPNFALEGDFGANYKDGNDFSTYSIGHASPMWRSVNLFVHTLLGETT